MPNYRLIALALICLLLSSCGRESEPIGNTGISHSGSSGTTAIPDVGPMIKKIATQDGSKDFTAEMKMTSIDDVGKRDQVEFKIQRKNSGDRTLTFLTVISPREETDKAFLAIEETNKPTEGYSYLAGLKKLAKLNSDKQLGFRGARVTVQELLGMELNQYELGSAERIDDGGYKLIKAELKAKPDLGLAYERIVAYLDEAKEQPVRFELYDSRNELSKTIVIEEVKQIQNRQTITGVAIDDLQQKLKLKIETRKVEYDRGIPDKIFTEDYLKNFISGASRRLDQ